MSRVYRATEIKGGKQVALKILLKPQNENQPSLHINSVKDYSSPTLQCPHIISVYKFYENDNVIISAMEYVNGGDIFDWLLSHDSYSESGVSIIIHHLLIAVQVLHNNGIVHRNIKPENILVSTANTGATIKLGDFGYANVLDTIDQFKEISFADPCTSPEILTGQSYGPPTDIWSIGVIAYILLIGNWPIQNNIQLSFPKEIPFNQSQWKKISPEAKDFVKSLLAIDPNSRIPVELALNHPWITSPEQDTPLNEAFQNLQVTSMARKLKRGMGATISASSFRQFTALAQKRD